MSNPNPPYISFWKYMKKAKGKALLLLFIIIGIVASVIWFRLDGSFDVAGTTIAISIIWLLTFFFHWRRYLKGKQY